MASFKTASALLLSLLAPSALALPSVRRQDACSGNPLEYKDLEVSEPYEGGYKMVPDLSCQSSEDQDCELTQGKAVAYTVEYSVGGGLGGAMDLGRILSFGLELGFGVA